jgi:hypothetical protein
MSSTGTYPLRLNNHINYDRLLECYDRMWPIIPPMSVRLFLDRSNVINDSFSAIDVFIN